MQNFIVLGIIPGTNYQTTFSFWLSVSAAFVALLALPYWISLAKSTHRYLVMRKIARTINHYDLVTI